MKTFNDFMKSQNEIFGFFKKQPDPNPLYDHPEYGAAFINLVQKHNGDEKAAEVELRQIASTPAGKFQLMRMAAQIPDRDSQHDASKVNWRATSTSGEDMMKRRQ